MNFESLFDAHDLKTLDELWHTYGTRPKTVSNKRRSAYLPGPFLPKLGSRADAARHFQRTGGRFGRLAEPPWVLRARTSYFRDEYVHGPVVRISGAERILTHGALTDAARRLYGRQVIVPYLVYGNLLVPGQELGLHTDVPAFRGADQTVLPLWFLVVMRHSGLFERWRLPIATAVAFVGEPDGGEFAYYPDGPSGLVRQIDPESGSVLMLDADTVFHGVDRVSGDDSGMRAVTKGSRARLINGGKRRWILRIVPLTPVRRDVVPRFTYASEELRFSASWKAYCFADEDDRRSWIDHTDDLRAETIMDALIAELCERGALQSEDHQLSDTELAHLMIDTFIQFPEVTFNPVSAPGMSGPGMSAPEVVSAPGAESRPSL